LALNAERPGAKNIYWMTSAVLAKDCKIARDDLRAKLKENFVDTRPFFYPLSSVPVLKAMQTEKDNPVAYSIAPRGMNLPSGHNLVEDDIDYICARIREALGRKSIPTERSGAIAKIMGVKNSAPPQRLKFSVDGKDCFLEAVTYKAVSEEASIEVLAKWRRKTAEWFPAQFEVTLDGTREWLKKAVLDQKDRILFWVFDSTGSRIGHVGLFRLSLDQRHIEIDNIVRGESTADKEIMACALTELLRWQKTELNIGKSYLRVFSDNQAALKLYQKLKYEEVQRVPLKCVVSSPTRKEWKEVVSDPYTAVQRYFVTMVKTL
jgi:RimJ/RimL family protein N-acetyltransferase